jgi:hypothetical protein
MFPDHVELRLIAVYFLHTGKCQLWQITAPCINILYHNTTKRGNGMATIREKEKRQTQTYLGGGD